VESPTQRHDHFVQAANCVFDGRKIGILVLLCALTAALGPHAPAQSSVSFPDNPRFTVQRLADEFGLGAVTVTSMGQDSQGFVWIGTQTGLYRYDGARARKIAEVEGLIGHYVIDVVIAPDGTPWFAGNRGIAHFKNGQFEALAIPPAALPLGNGSQFFAVDSKDVVYVALFEGGILRADSRHPSQTRILEEDAGVGRPVNGIVRAQDDSIWFVSGTYLAHLEPDSMKAVVDGRAKVPRERAIALVWDLQHRLWLRTSTKVARLDPVSHQFIYEDVAVGPSDEVEGKPTLDQKGRLLVPSLTGLYWQDEAGRWRTITDKQGISSNDIQFAMEDREGTLWIAGSGTGLDRLPGVREWSGWSGAEGLPDNTTWATQRDHQGRLWVSTSHGIGVWDGQQHRWLHVPYFQGASKSQARQLQLADDGSVWTATITGAVVRIDSIDFSATAQENYHGKPFQALSASPSGEIWAITTQNLVRFNATNPSNEPVNLTVPLEEGRQLIYLAFSPEGALWLTSTGAVYRFDGQNWKTLTMREGLQGQEITGMTVLSDNEVWVAYNDVVGVTRILLDSSGKTKMEHHAWDWLIAGQDSQKRVWFDGPEGLAVLSPNGSIRRISHAQGLLWDDVSPWTAVREEKDRSFAIATSRGLARYRPEEVESRGHVDAVLTYVALGGEERDIHETPKVRPADASLTVQFTPMILANPEQVSCRYQLKGLEKQFRQTHLREVQYGGLPTGKYEFWVQCIRPETGKASAPAIFRFEVLPNLWQTWWARVAGGFVLLGCFWAYVFLRTRALERRRAELEQAVAQRSAELVLKNKELEEASLTDPLTGTRNRRYFYETIPTDIAQAERSHLKNRESDSGENCQELIFVLVDIDRFKRVNDELGHTAGDHLLREVAKRIASVMRRSDDLVRWGGEEFMLVCRTTDRENAPLLCNRVLEVIRDLPFDVGNGVEVHKTCSIGWAPYPWLKDDVGLLSLDNVIELADKALYLAKREGRNRAYGLLPSEDVYKSEKSVSIENLRDCPPDLVQIV
jgi:diguanylate cyclase (GGDEF)-like protein